MNPSTYCIVSRHYTQGGFRVSIDDFNLSRTQWIYLIDEYIFSERDRRILKRRLLDAVTFEKLAEEEFLSVQRTKEVFYRAKDKLLRHVI